MSDRSGGRREAWLASLVDPFRERLLAAGEALPREIEQVAEPLQGEPASDPAEVGRRAAAIPLPPEARFRDPLLERAVRVGLGHIDLTFQVDHPKYGVGVYAQPQHDGFPPTVIAAVDALTLWELTPRAEALFSYWLRHFVREDGTIDYYGPSLSEYGQLLTSARRLMERGGSEGWLREHRPPLARLAGYLRERLWEGGKMALPRGVPEADERRQAATYLHNSAWIVRGLEDWAALGEDGGDPEALAAREDAASLQALLLDTIREIWPADLADWWLRPMLEEGDGYWQRPVGRVTANRLGSYTNYRYWPELLSSGVLPREWMRRLVDARLAGGGQFCGVTRFLDHLDDWPLMEHLEGLWSLGMRDDYRLCLWGHLYFHQAQGHLTAYEQVSFPPGRAVADYCLPCQLVAVRAARRLT